MSNGISNYLSRFVRRKSIDNGADHPTPRPFHYDYFPTHNIRIPGYQDYTPSKQEDVKMIARFKDVTFRYPGPRKNIDRMIKYDHWKMNYFDFNA